MFDKKIDIAKVYGNIGNAPMQAVDKPNFLPRVNGAIRPGKKATRSPKNKEKKYRGHETYLEYQEMRKTPEFWVWWKRQYAKQNALCYHCDETLKGKFINVEHIIPMSRGGKNTKNNMVLACAACNKEKGSKMLSKKIRKQRKMRLKLRVKDQQEWYREHTDYQADLATFYRNNF